MFYLIKSKEFKVSLTKEDEAKLEDEWPSSLDEIKACNSIKFVTGKTIRRFKINHNDEGFDLEEYEWLLTVAILFPVFIPGGFYLFWFIDLFHG